VDPEYVEGAETQAGHRLEYSSLSLGGVGFGGGKGHTSHLQKESDGVERER